MSKASDVEQDIPQDIFEVGESSNIISSILFIFKILLV